MPYSTMNQFDADLATARDRIDSRIPQAGWPQGERAKAICDALNNIWRAGITLDEWVGAAARLLGD